MVYNPQCWTRVMPGGTACTAQFITACDHINDWQYILDYCSVLKISINPYFKTWNSSQIIEIFIFSFCDGSVSVFTIHICSQLIAGQRSNRAEDNWPNILSAPNNAIQSFCVWNTGTQTYATSCSRSSNLSDLQQVHYAHHRRYLGRGHKHFCQESAASVSKMLGQHKRNFCTLMQQCNTRICLMATIFMDIH